MALADSTFFDADYEKALVLYNNCLTKKETYSNEILATIYMRRGICYNYSFKYDDAINDYLLALKIFDATKNEQGIAKAYFNLARTYLNSKDYVSTGKYILKSEALFIKLKDTVSLLNVLNSKAIYLFETQGSRESIDIKLYAIKKYKDNFPDELLQRFYFNLGDDYAQFSSDSALFYYNKVLSIVNENKDSTLLPTLYNNLGDIYLEQNNLKLAGKYLQDCIKIADLQADSLLARELMQNLSIFYYRTGSYKKAYEYADSARMINEALFNKDKTTVLAELSEKYEAEKKDTTITLQKKENSNKTKGLVATGIGLALVALLAAFSYRQYRKTQKTNALLEKQNEAIHNLNQQLHQANQTKVSLFSIISHDLRAPLSSLYALLQTQNLQQKTTTTNNDAVTKQTEQLLDTLENLLLWSKTQLEQFTLHVVPTNLPNTLKEIEQLYSPIITSKKITVTHNVTGSGVLQTDQDVLNVICRNIYSNALQNAPIHSTINIQYQLHNNLHIVECSNHYESTNTNETMLFSERGLGTTLIKDFCNKINATVHFSAGQNIFTVLLKVPTVSVN